VGGGRSFVHEKGEVGRFRSAMSTMEDNRIGSNIFGLGYARDGPTGNGGGWSFPPFESSSWWLVFGQES